MLKIMRWAFGSASLLLVLAAPSGALAAGEPVGGGAGCKANGQAVAAAAQSSGPFGQFVRTQAPIADDVAQFKAALCKPPSVR
jgi:hypothetical protein